VSTAPVERVWNPVRRWFSDESLTQKASLNAMASALDYAARLVAGFVMTPFLVRGLGDYGYGVWQVLGRLIGYVSPASGRPGQALKWTIARLQLSRDFEEKRRQVGSAVWVWLLFLPVLALVGAALTWLAPGWLEASAALTWSVRAATALLVVDMILTSLTDIPRSVLQGENLGYRRMGLSAVLVFVGAAFTALALYSNAGLVGVATAELAATVLTGVLFLKVTRACVPWFGLARPRPGALRAFLGLSGWFLAWNLTMQLIRASDVVILGVFGSAELVTTYSLTRYAPETVVSLVAIIVFGITPGLGAIIGAGETDKAIRVRNEIMTFTWLLVTALGSTILLWNHSLVRLWVGPRHYVGALPNLLMMVMAGQLVLIRNDANIIDLTLDLRRKVLSGLFSTALCALAAAFAVGWMQRGVVGLCASFIAGRLLLSLGYPWLVGRFLGVPFSRQLQRAIRPALATAALFAAGTLASRVVAVGSWLALAALAGLTLAGTALAAFYGGLSGTQRQHVLDRVARIARGRRP
jgi:O-antigen/teichoic acid export membrane protein